MEREPIYRQGETLRTFAAGLYGLDIYEVPYDVGQMTVDLDALARQAQEIKLRLIIIAGSMCLFPFPVAAVREATGGKGADTTIDCAGGDETFDQAIKMTKPAGRIILVAYYHGPVTADLSDAVRRNLTIYTERGEGGTTVGQALALLASGRVQARQLVSHTFPSPAWVTAYGEAINASATYREHSLEWTHGAVALVVNAQPDLGMAEPVGVWLDLERGACRDARLVTQQEAEAASFVITGDYERWKQVIRKELGPIAGIMQRKLALKGSLPIVVRFVKSAEALVEAATRVPTKFLDEAGGG